MSKKSQAQNLTELREQIAKLNAEFGVVRAAGLPAAEVAQSIRTQVVHCCERFRAIQRRIATCLEDGYDESIASLLGPMITKSDPAELAFGAAVAAYGADRFMDEAIALARNHGELRLPADEREARLKDLLERRHSLELLECDLVESTGAAHRPDVTTGAVLGIPFDVLFEAGLIGGRK